MSRYFRQVIRDMWLGLLAGLAIPLRLITGRRRPDYDRIGWLELELGLRPPANFIEMFYDPRLSSDRRLSSRNIEMEAFRRKLSGEPMVLGQDWEYILLDGNDNG